MAPWPGRYYKMVADVMKPYWDAQAKKGKRVTEEEVRLHARILELANKADYEIGELVDAIKDGYKADARIKELVANAEMS